MLILNSDIALRGITWTGNEVIVIFVWSLDIYEGISYQIWKYEGWG